MNEKKHTIPGTAPGSRETQRSVDAAADASAHEASDEQVAAEVDPCEDMYYLTRPRTLDPSGQLSLPDFPMHLVPEKMATVAQGFGRAFHVSDAAGFLTQVFLIAQAVGPHIKVPIAPTEPLSLSPCVHLFCRDRRPVGQMLHAMLGMFVEVMAEFEPALAAWPNHSMQSSLMLDLRSRGLLNPHHDWESSAPKSAGQGTSAPASFGAKGTTNPLVLRLEYDGDEECCCSIIHCEDGDCHSLRISPAPMQFVDPFARPDRDVLAHGESGTVEMLGDCMRKGWISAETAEDIAGSILRRELPGTFNYPVACTWRETDCTENPGLQAVSDEARNSLKELLCEAFALRLRCGQDGLNLAWSKEAEAAQVPLLDAHKAVVISTDAGTHPQCNMFLRPYMTCYLAGIFHMVGGADVASPIPMDTWRAANTIVEFFGDSQAAVTASLLSDSERRAAHQLLSHASLLDPSLTAADIVGLQLPLLSGMGEVRMALQVLVRFGSVLMLPPGGPAEHEPYSTVYCFHPHVHGLTRSSTSWTTPDDQLRPE